jgi:hypothetical protein
MWLLAVSPAEIYKRKTVNLKIFRGDPCKTPRASKTPHGLFSETIDHFSFFNIPRYQTNKEGSSDAMGWLFLFVGSCYPPKRVFGGFLK